MVLLIILIVTEILTVTVIRQHLYDTSWMKYYFLIMVHFVASIWMWILWYKTVSFNGIFDEPQHIWMIMCLTGVIAGVVIPRILLILFHFTGVVIRIKTGKRRRLFTNTGLILSGLIFITVALSTFAGRFHFRTERITINIKDLKKDLNGLKIVQISDLHLASFYHHKDMMIRAIELINKEQPDFLVNTGDFVSYGWREFGRFDTLLKDAKSRYGSFAALGNHDFGTYHPFFTESDKDNNIMLMKKLISSSGYIILDNESAIVTVENSDVAFTGVETRGSFPKIIHSDPVTASAGTDSADLKILLAHDPNQWKKDVTGKTGFSITLSGHTHGMQMGILSKKLKWSPAKYFYPEWNGLYKSDDQFLVVNRGLGVLGLPFRIWMPPEITVITIVSD